MGMVVDMLLTIAVVAVAATTVAELQVRVGDIRSAADGTPVGIGNGDLDVWLLRRKGNRAGFFGSALSAPLYPPGQGNDVHHILAEEQEVVGKRNDGKEIVGEGVYHKTDDH